MFDKLEVDIVWKALIKFFVSLYQVEQIKHQLANYLRALVSYKRCSPFGLLQKKMLDRFFIEVGFLFSLGQSRPTAGKA